MEDPMDPRHTQKTSIQKLDVIPVSGINTMTSRGPPRAKNREGWRSARYPTGGCTTKARKRLRPVTRPACARVKENLSMKSGSRGMIKAL